MKKEMILAIGLCLTGCSGGKKDSRSNDGENPVVLDKGADTDSAANTTDSDSNDDPIDEKSAEQLMRDSLDGALQKLRVLDKDGQQLRCSGENHAQYEPCHLRELVYSPARNDKGQKTRIMMIDSGMELPSLLRYKSRNLGFYRIEGDGSVQERFTPESLTGVRVPKVLFDLYGDWDRIAGGPVFPEGEEATEMFDRLGAFLLETELLGFAFPAHGSSLYFKVAELNPESELLVVQGHSGTGFFPASAFKGADGMCRLNTREQKEAVHNIFANLTRDLQALARTYQIDYIHFASGFNKEVFYNRFPECKGVTNRSAVEDFLQQYQAFEKSIGSIPGTVLVQAAWSSRHPVSVEEVNTPDYADCNQHTNKILAHPANFAKDVALPKEGLDVHGNLPDSLISTNSLNLSNCGGLYVSLGKTLQNPRLTNEFAIGFSDFGLYSDDTYMLSSSYVTPVLLSYLDFIRRTEHGSIAADASLHRIKQGRVIEPMRYRQFMSIHE